MSVVYSKEQLLSAIPDVKALLQNDWAVAGNVSRYETSGFAQADAEKIEDFKSYVEKQTGIGFGLPFEGDLKEISCVFLRILQKA